MLATIDLDRLHQLPGVTQVVADGSFVAIVGPGEAELVSALPRAHACVTWQRPAEHALPRYPEAFEAVAAASPVALPEPPEGGQSLRLSFQRGFVAPASIGTSTAIARWRPDRQGLEIWTHSQGVFPMRRQLSQAFGLAETEIIVRHRPHAGCYGHNGADDAAFEAALIARTRPGQPVRLVWTREEELAASPLGSAMQVDIAATVDSRGCIVAWRNRTHSGTHAGRPGWGTGVKFASAQRLAEPHAAGDLTDIPAALGHGALRNAWPMYAAEIATCSTAITPMPMRTSSLRALGAHLQVMAIESTMDELAARLELDPLSLRLKHLPDPRARAVVERAAALSAWSERYAQGDAIGFGFARYKNKAAYMAIVVLLDLAHDVKVEQVWAAVDAGEVVHPDGVRNQVEGGILQALSWTLKEEVLFDVDGCQSTDWERYPLLRFDEVPPIHLDLLSPDTDVPLGVGEVAAGPTAAAVANALARGLGVRLTRMPFTRDRIIAALA
jgi:nicotinate dehydrogenase subunit B